MKRRYGISVHSLNLLPSGLSQVFCRTVNPISTRGADYAHHSAKSPPPTFKPCDGPDLANTEMKI